MRWLPLALVLAFFVPAAATACSCAPRWMIIQSELTNGRGVVFVGEVEGEAPVSPASGRESFFSLRLLRIRPDLFLRGSWPTRPVEVWVDGFGECGSSLDVGQTYVVFGRRAEDGKLAASGMCSSTAPLWGYGLFLAVLALFGIAAVAGTWGLWRLVRRLRRASWWPSRFRIQTQRASRAEERPRRAALRWLAAAAGLAVVATLLWSIGPLLAPPAEVTVCNRGVEEPLEQVEVRLMPESREQPGVLLGHLPPGECRSVPLQPRAAASVRLTYRLQGASFTVRDPPLEHLEGGLRVFTLVQGPGKTESGMNLDFEAPTLPVRILALSLLAAMVGAFAAAFCAAGTGAWGLLRRLRARPRTSP